MCKRGDSFLFYINFCNSGWCVMKLKALVSSWLLRFVRVSKFCFFYNLFIGLNVSLANSSPHIFHMQPQNLDP